MAEENDDNLQDRTEEPSETRVEEFRKRGEVASSKELANVLILMASIITLALSAVYIFEKMQELVMWLYNMDIKEFYNKRSAAFILKKIASVFYHSTGPILATTAVVGVLSYVLQIGFLFSPEVLSIKFDRINPVNGFKRLFSMKSLVEAIKGIAKFSLILFIIYLFMYNNLDIYKGFYHSELIQSSFVGGQIITELGAYILASLLIVSIGDFAYQKFSYRRKLMMTKEQAKRELREKEGNPEIRQRIRNVQRDFSRRKMLREVPSADVIITNPTHISVALKYDKNKMISPKVVAKGTGVWALRIRKSAQDNKVPVIENVELARSLYKIVPLGMEIPSILYKAVAKVLSFAYRLKKKQAAL